MAKYKMNPIDIPDSNTTFSPREWKYFIEEVKMRGIEKADLCINNAKYLAMIDRAHEGVAAGRVITKTFAELEAMANG